MTVQGTFLPATLGERPVVILGWYTQTETVDHGMTETYPVAIVTDVETGGIETVTTHSLYIETSCLTPEQTGMLALLRHRHPSMPESLAQETVKVRWYCGAYVTAHDFGTEAKECATEFDTTEDKQDWLDKGCVAICPSCQAQLSQQFDDPAELVQDE